MNKFISIALSLGIGACGAAPEVTQSKTAKIIDGESQAMNVVTECERLVSDALANKPRTSIERLGTYSVRAEGANSEPQLFNFGGATCSVETGEYTTSLIYTRPLQLAEGDHIDQLTIFNHDASRRPKLFHSSSPCPDDYVCGVGYQVVDERNQALITAAVERMSADLFKTE